MWHIDGILLELMVVFTRILSMRSAPSMSDDSENSNSEPDRWFGLFTDSIGEFDEFMPLSGEIPPVGSLCTTATIVAFVLAGLRFTVPVLSLEKSRSKLLPGEQLLAIDNFDKELFLSGTAGPKLRLLLLPVAKRVVQTVPALLVVVEVEPLPNSSYSFSALITVSSLEKADVECKGVAGASSSLRVFNPLSMWKEV